MAFGLNDKCYGWNRGIVCDNMPILCTHVHIGMENNVAGGSFPFRRTEKPFSIFRVPKNEAFYETTIKWKFQNGTNIFFKNIRPNYMDNVPNGVSQTFSSTPREKDNFLPNR